MAEEPGKGAPSLEPPRLWRKKKAGQEVDPVETAAPNAVTTPQAPTPATRVETPWVPAGPPPKRARNQAPKPTKTPRASQAPQAPKAPKAAKPSREARVPKPPRAPRQRIQLPPVEPHLAAAITGLLVGGWLVLSTFSTLRMCESVRGASACGGPGLLLLLVIVVGGIALGASLLRYFKIRSAGSMSFLAVALVAVLVMVFFAGSLDQWWTIPVIAVLTVAAYSLSHWITTTYIDPED